MCSFLLDKLQTLFTYTSDLSIKMPLWREIYTISSILQAQEMDYEKRLH